MNPNSSSPPAAAASPLRYLPALLLMASGLFLAIGGACLAYLGGSWFYLPMGIATLASGVLVWRSKPAGALLFGAAFMNIIGGRSSRYQEAGMSIRSVSLPRLSGFIQADGCLL